MGFLVLEAVCALPGQHGQGLVSVGLKEVAMPSSGAQDGSGGDSHPPKELLQVKSCCLGVLTGEEAFMMIPLLFLLLPIRVSCLFGEPRLLPSIPSVAMA